MSECKTGKEGAHHVQAFSSDISSADSKILPEIFMATIVMSFGKGIGHVRKGVGCADKELLTFGDGTAICGICMLRDVN